MTNHCLRSLGRTYLAGNTSRWSKPGTLSPSKKLKQLARFDLELGLYPSMALYRRVTVTLSAARDKSGTKIPLMISWFSFISTLSNISPTLSPLKFFNVTCFSKYRKALPLPLSSYQYLTFRIVWRPISSPLRNLSTKVKLSSTNSWVL